MRAQNILREIKIAYYNSIMILTQRPRLVTFRMHLLLLRGVVAASFAAAAADEMNK